MVSLVWEDWFDTGIEVIDAQHKSIFEYMTRIYNRLIEEQQSGLNVSSKLDQLAIICKLHFLEEENLMDDISYPSSAHKQLHDMFLAHIDRVRSANENCHPTELLDNFMSLREDFISHILVETQEICDYIKKQAVVRLA